MISAIAVSRGRKKEAPARIHPELAGAVELFLVGSPTSTEIFSPAKNPSMDSTTTTHD
jgi:hypothetical protein